MLVQSDILSFTWIIIMVDQVKTIMRALISQMKLWRWIEGVFNQKSKRNLQKSTSDLFINDHLHELNGHYLKFWRRLDHKACFDSEIFWHEHIGHAFTNNTTRKSIYHQCSENWWNLSLCADQRKSKELIHLN